MLTVKNRDLKDLALASLGINLTSQEKAMALAELKAVPQESWYRCEFRNCDLLLVYGGDQVLEKEHINWTSVAEHCPQLKKIVEKVLNPYFLIKPRIIILKTRTDEELNWHVDCDQQELNSFQPKLRCLISGNKDDLYFLGKNGDKVHEAIQSDLYYMSGAFVHALKNRTLQDRYVLCFGSPWKEQHVAPEFIDLLNHLPDEAMLWSDQLVTQGREAYVRIPQKHGLIKYGSA